MTHLLEWLPAAPADLRGRCAAAVDVAALTGLAGCALNTNQLRSLANALDRFPAEARATLVPFRLGLLSNATVDLLVSALRATGLRHGLDLTIEVGAYDQVLAEATDPASPINVTRCDAVLVAVDHHVLPERGFNDDVSTDAAALFAMAREGIAAHSGAPVIFATIPTPPESFFGSFDALLGGTKRSAVSASNAAIREFVRGSSGDLLFDVEALANCVGTARWHDPVQWNVAKLPFALEMVPIYAEHLARILASMRGKSRKCLVLDLDNTLWGGVIGDDGLAGIVLGQGSALGEAFLEVQRTALKLRDRGIILAVCSKNDNAVARSAFRQHPEMLLREEHIAAFVANWTDKATNLEVIADQLSIGIDSLVFLDDNPAERAQVRQELPQVAVPELPEDPSLYSRTMLAAGYFEAIAFLDEDCQRAAQYEANQKRDSVKSATRDMGAYLQSLAMVATMRPFEAIARARVAQLINKSNQFNLTTRRYTEAQIEALENAGDALTLQIRLRDMFGDNGIVSVIIGRRTGDIVDIDTWLMSCRVLGRGLEQAVLNQIVAEARAFGATQLLGRFVPSARNEMVREHYPKLGFAPVDEKADGATLWSLDLTTFKPRATHIQIIAAHSESA
ncbi:HAD-IIIC family phosphatase [Sphingomonas sp. AR_OL41]|uniref:HAD-IIIC family phosphatase n=1 Tax=Sphingomonas sp. AR_OL41 TaxID=3042729 RepID=UPI002481137A|nr:HAD-IIIC family phosphatase [Sphingomonas sp. AR_OL41]MDH7975771.1 HAD-IIIC family phosphatase [Sphingomonas sp. AR_OL41]